MFLCLILVSIVEQGEYLYCFPTYKTSQPSSRIWTQITSFRCGRIDRILACYLSVGQVSQTDGNQTLHVSYKNIWFRGLDIFVRQFVLSTQWRTLIVKQHLPLVKDMIWKNSITMSKKDAAFVTVSTRSALFVCGKFSYSCSLLQLSSHCWDFWSLCLVQATKTWSI